MNMKLYQSMGNGATQSVPAPNWIGQGGGRASPRHSSAAAKSAHYSTCSTRVGARSLLLAARRSAPVSCKIASLLAPPPARYRRSPLPSAILASMAAGQRCISCMGIVYPVGSFAPFVRRQNIAC
jgi:hypothetical protein